MFQILTPTEAHVASVCVIDGCCRAMLSSYHGLCRPHYDRKLRTGIVGGTIKPLASRGSGHRRRDGRIMVEVGGKKQLEHRVIAERVIGRPLPHGAEIHHIDENPGNNAPTNLVICPDAAYHKLLHQRQRAFDACGNYGWRKCQFCKRYDAPENMWTSRKKAHHRECDAARARERKLYLAGENHV